jgi:hypothetical protein
MIGAVLGGVDIAILAKRNPDIFWKTDGAQKATSITLQAGTIKTPDGFAESRLDVRFVIMASALSDLCSQLALIEAYPQNYRHLPMAEIEGVGLREKLQFPPNPLTAEIERTEARVLEMWRNVYVPPKKPEQPRRLTVVS